MILGNFLTMIIAVDRPSDSKYATDFDVDTIRNIWYNMWFVTTSLNAGHFWVKFILWRIPPVMIQR